MGDELKTRLENAAEIAIKEAKKIEDNKKSLEAKTSEEAKKAENKDSKEQATKPPEANPVKEAEDKAKQDEEILSKEESELTDEQKTRKSELLKEKQKSEDKVEERKKEIQKEIDVLISNKKAIEAELGDVRKLSERISKLESELAESKKPKEQEDLATKVKKEQQARIDKYSEEDRSKPREARREMSKEELEDWLLEDLTAATEWMADRSVRRSEEKKEIAKALDKSFDVDVKKTAEEFIKKQNESLKKLVDRFPKVVPSKERLAELKGKSQDEIDKILSDESEEYRLCLDIARSDPKYVSLVNGPELVMEEMEKRLKDKNKSDSITLTKAELDKKIKEEAEREIQRRASLDEGITSTGGKKMETTEKKSEFRIEQERIARKAGIPMDKLDEAIKRREHIPGARFTNRENYDKVS